VKGGRGDKEANEGFRIRWGHLDCFQCLAATSIVEQVSLWSSGTYFGFMPKNDTAGS